VGREVDQPWLDDPHVRDSRMLHEVPDRRGAAVRPRGVKVELADGRQVVVRDRAGVAEIQPIPQTTIDEQRGTVLIHGTAEDLAKAVTRFERDHPEVQWLPSQPGEQYPRSIAVPQEYDVETWPRFAAKVALGVMSRLVDDDWLDSATANALQDILWSGAKQAAALDDRGWAWSAVPLGIDVTKPPGNMLRDAEHLLLFEELNGTAALCMILFGDWLYRVPLPKSELPSEPPAWLFDSIERSVAEYPSHAIHPVVAMRAQAAPKARRPRRGW
jgi:hypothetical protein